jgi:hypothetical protein
MPILHAEEQAVGDAFEKATCIGCSAQKALDARRNAIASQTICEEDKASYVSHLDKQQACLNEAAKRMTCATVEKTLPEDSSPVPAFGSPEWKEYQMLCPAYCARNNE